MNDRKIEHVNIEDETVAGMNLGKRVVVQFEGDGDTNVVLFTYYPDELTFTAAELIGLTQTEAMRLRSDRDIAYLRS